MNLHRFILPALMSMAGIAPAQTATLHVVEENGPRSQRINLVFLSEGYTTTDLPNFAGHVQNAVNFLFTREPWQQYRSYCNIYRIEIASNESGTDNGTGGGTKDTYFNSGFNTPSITQLLTLGSGGAGKAYSLLNAHVPEYDVPVVLVNDTKYGGAGGSISVASVDGSSAGVVEHEIGHSFAGLADEYDTNYTQYTPAERPNNTAVTDPEQIKWRDWFEASTPIPTPETAAYDSLVGLFEGSMYRTSGWYRPHNDSLMRRLFRPCGQVNRQEFVLSYYERVSPIEGRAPTATGQSADGPQTLSFSVTPKAPSSGIALDVTWKLDGAALPGETEAMFELVSDIAGDGVHTLTAEVHDPTPFVRNDPTGLLTDTTSWTLTLTNQLPNTVAGWRTEFGGDSDNPSGDGLKNLIKYALGLDPNNAVTPRDHVQPSLTDSTGAAIAAETQSGESYLTLTIPRRLRRTDVVMTVEVSPNLNDWFSGPPHTVTLVDTDTLLVVRDATPIGPGIKRFMRLKVTPVE